MDEKMYKYIYEELLRLSDDGFIVVTPDGKVADINENYCRFLGKERDHIIGQNVFSIISNSHMVDLIRSGGRDECDVHRYTRGDTHDPADKFVVVSRSCVFNDQQEAICSVAQVKFSQQTMDSMQKLMQQYAELETFKTNYCEHYTKANSFERILGESQSLINVKHLGIKAAQTNFPVLLTGESGTGKELFARAIHNASNRSGKPIVSINCAAIPAELIESELFGYKEGAFTGARRGGQQGKFLQADHGTIFLDEIGDMPLNMQSKLLRVLQEKEVDPIGGSSPVPVDIRVIAATRKNLQQMVENGQFREDLFYRICVVNIELPPLRDRREDIMTLSNYFLNKINSEYNTTVALSKDVKSCFLKYNWPGNIRELDNVIKSAYASCDGLFICLENLPAKMISRQVFQAQQGKTLKQMVDGYETSIIKEFLRKHNWNIQSTAEELGIHRSLLYKKMEKYSIRPRKILE
ncbi:sigma-54 interaction domain-containing protein [Candidatus Pseudoscillospira sp. SGI.172]|uniref:sigma-54 interaction domain-containing protein n=1 Tax=Candidatus Pseudoscillospira sp. SGI.172 TaxID=3420582 RepID=UPI003D07BFA3